jgi:chromosomal replication initiation ATPase DnaA
MIQTMTSDPASHILLERDLWLVGAEWHRAVEHVIDRLHRVKAFSGILSTPETAPDERVRHDVAQLQEWGADGSVDWERELARYINENMARSIRANVQAVRQLRTEARSRAVQVTTALPVLSGEAVLRHIGLTGDIELRRIS